MEDNKILKLVYTFFLGVLLALFVGAGVSTFYPQPEYPEYPQEAIVYNEQPTKEQQQAQTEHDKLVREFEETKMQPYNRNVSIITLIAAVIFLTVSLAFEKKIKVIADGVMLGGLFTLLYSIGRGFAANDDKYVFGVITIGLILVLYLGYHRFVRPQTTKKPAKQEKE